MHRSACGPKLLSRHCACMCHKRAHPRHAPRFAPLPLQREGAMSQAGEPARASTRVKAPDTAKKSALAELAAKKARADKARSRKRCAPVGRSAARAVRPGESQAPARLLSSRDRRAAVPAGAASRLRAQLLE